MLPFMEPGLVKVFRKQATGQVDRYGKPITARNLVGTYAGRIEGQKSVEGEAFVVDTFRAWIDKAADLQAGDEIEARGQVHAIDGAPFLNTAPGLEALAHWEALLRRTGPVTS